MALKWATTWRSHFFTHARSSCHRIALKYVTTWQPHFFTRACFSCGRMALKWVTQKYCPKRIVSMRDAGVINSAKHTEQGVCVALSKPIPNTWCYVCVVVLGCLINCCHAFNMFSLCFCYPFVMWSLCCCLVFLWLFYVFVRCCCVFALLFLCLSYTFLIFVLRVS